MNDVNLLIIPLKDRFPLNFLSPSALVIVKELTANALRIDWEGLKKWDRLRSTTSYIWYLPLPCLPKLGSQTNVFNAYLRYWRGNMKKTIVKCSKIEMGL
jgi:hypothetical protein